MTGERRTTISMFKKISVVLSLCLFLLQPHSGWAADGGDNWRNLSPKERENIQRNYRRWQSLPPRDKEYLREEWNRWQNLPQDRRDQLKNRYEDMRRRRQHQD
jgi:Protein of unknown function (DUF3106)